MELSSTRTFRLVPERVYCDSDGLSIGGVPMLVRTVGGAWTLREASSLNVALTRRYGLPVEIAAKREGLQAVAQALTLGEIARAQIAALLLQWPDPPEAGVDRPALAHALAESRLLKADADWDAQHPRTGTAPNPGWFAVRQARRARARSQNSVPIRRRNPRQRLRPIRLRTRNM